MTAKEKLNEFTKRFNYCKSIIEQNILSIKDEYEIIKEARKYDASITNRNDAIYTLAKIKTIESYK